MDKPLNAPPRREGGLIVLFAGLLIGFGIGCVAAAVLL